MKVRKTRNTLNVNKRNSVGRFKSSPGGDHLSEKSFRRNVVKKKGPHVR